VEGHEEHRRIGATKSTKNTKLEGTKVIIYKTILLMPSFIVV